MKGTFLFLILLNTKLMIISDNFVTGFQQGTLRSNTELVLPSEHTVGL